MCVFASDPQIIVVHFFPFLEDTQQLMNNNFCLLSVKIIVASPSKYVLKVKLVLDCST